MRYARIPAPKPPSVSGLSRARRLAVDDHAQRSKLDTIEQAIAHHRVLYLQATWAGHQGEADWHETEVDRLLGEWDDVRSGRKAKR